MVGDALASPVARRPGRRRSIAGCPTGIHLHLQGLRRRGRKGLAYFGQPSADIDAIYTLESRRDESYDSGEIRLRQSFGAEYGWLVGYTRSSTRSNAVLGNSPDSYFVAADNRGPLSWDTPHRVVTWAFLPTFRKPWSVSYLVEYRTGFPYLGGRQRRLRRRPAQLPPLPRLLRPHARPRAPHATCSGRRWALRAQHEQRHQSRRTRPA